MSYNNIRERGKRMNDLKKCQKLWKEYFQEHNRKEKDDKAEEKLDGL